MPIYYFRYYRQMPEEQGISFNYHETTTKLNLTSKLPGPHPIHNVQQQFSNEPSTGHPVKLAGDLLGTAGHADYFIAFNYAFFLLQLPFIVLSMLHLKLFQLFPQLFPRGCECSKLAG